MTPTYRTVLLASHDTPGARAAEEAALGLCEKAATLWHLCVVPDFWQGMRGDDWLNNAITQIRFGDYVENQLAREIAEHSARLGQAATAKGIVYRQVSRLGQPAACLIEVSNLAAFDLVVVGSRRPRGVSGYRSRLDLDQLSRALKAPLLVVPYPGR
jgi:nucleotide-binding universal stress UspA family protein